MAGVILAGAAVSTFGTFGGMTVSNVLAAVCAANFLGLFSGAEATREDDIIQAQELAAVMRSGTPEEVEDAHGKLAEVMMNKIIPAVMAKANAEQAIQPNNKGRDEL